MRDNTIYGVYLDNILMARFAFEGDAKYYCMFLKKNQQHNRKITYKEVGKNAVHNRVDN